MPKSAKKAQNAPKSSNKKAEKVVSDKTFGLKNKNKSKKVQKYVQSITNAVSGSKEQREAQKAKELRIAAKKQKEEQQKQLDMLFQSVGGKKETKPKAKVKICPYFIKGKCPRGDQCKLSHDWGNTRKVEKLDVYRDLREGTDLEPGSDITCRHFVEAVEKKKYGHNWECANGGANCQYQHKLPKGYVMKSEEERLAEAEAAEAEELPLEELIEQERSVLIDSGKELTPVTLDTFKAWKELKRKRREVEREEKQKEAVKKMGSKGVNVLSGRDLFQFDPSLFVDDEDAADDQEMEIRSDAEEDFNVRDKHLYREDEKLPDSDDD